MNTLYTLSTKDGAYTFTPQNTGWVVTPPTAPPPIQTITNPAGVGWQNPSTQAPRNAVNVIVNGGGDSAFIFGAKSGDLSPRLCQQCQANNVAAGNAVSYGKHGIYGDATITVTDFSATASQYAASGISFRWPNSSVQRANIGSSSAPFNLALTFYDSGQGFGTCTVDQVTLFSTNNTAFWASTNPDAGGKTIQQHFIIGPQVAATVKGGSLIFNADTMWDAGSTLTISRSATVNGKPVTAASIGGPIPQSAITWTP